MNILDLMCYGLLSFMKGKFVKVNDVQFQYRKSPDDSFLKLRKLQQLSHEFYARKLITYITDINYESIS